jgi:hypothetical protein
VISRKYRISRSTYFGIHFHLLLVLAPYGSFETYSWIIYKCTILLTTYVNTALSLKEKNSDIGFRTHKRNHHFNTCPPNLENFLRGNTTNLAKYSHQLRFFRQNSSRDSKSLIHVFFQIRHIFDVFPKMAFGINNCRKWRAEKSHMRTNTRRLGMNAVMTPAYITSGFWLRKYQALDFCSTECTSCYELSLTFGSLKFLAKVVSSVLLPLWRYMIDVIFLRSLVASVFHRWNLYIVNDCTQPVWTSTNTVVQDAKKW